MTLAGATPTPPEPQKIVRFYAGDGSEFYAGIPARDLTEEDWTQLTDEQRELVDRGHATGSRPLEATEGQEPTYEEIRTRLYTKKPASRKEG